MLHKILMSIMLLGAVNSFSQGVVVTPVKTDPQIDYKLPGAPMPQLRLASIDTSVKPDTSMQSPPHHRKNKKHKNEKPVTYITNADLDNGANLFIMMFNPTCSHCQAETQLIENNISLFKKSKWVFVGNPRRSIMTPIFVKQQHIYDFAPFYIGIDSSDFLNKVFLYKSLPQINIYNADRKLLKTYEGDTPIDSLKQYIE